MYTFGNKRTLITSLHVYLTLAVIVATLAFSALVMSYEQEVDVEVFAPVIAHIKEPTVVDKVYKYIKSLNPHIESAVARSLSISIVAESIKHDLPLKLVLAVIKTESHFKQYAISHAGAMGFWQVLPRAHYDKIAKLENKNLYDPVTNSALGAKILKDCMNKFKNVKGGLLCYNGSNYDETQEYANKVLAVAKTIKI